MEQLPRVPSGGRCSCGATVWYIRAAAPGQRSYFVCKRHGYGRRYLPRQDAWEPVRELVKGYFSDLNRKLDEEQAAEAAAATPTR